ncbi:Hypothetical protein FKW44_011250, partial [Caligus rogercresseyi]
DRESHTSSSNNNIVNSVGRFEESSIVSASSDGKKQHLDIIVSAELPPDKTHLSGCSGGN